MKPREHQGIHPPTDHVQGLFVQAAGGALEEYRRGLDGQRRVYVYREVEAHQILFLDLPQQIQHLLGPAYGEGRDHQIASLAKGDPDAVRQKVRRVVAGLVDPVSVGRLDDGVVRLPDVILPPEDGQIHIAQVSGEDHLPADPGLRQPHLDGGGAQQMPGVDKPDVNALGDGDLFSQRAGPEPLQAVFRVLQVVDRLHRIQTGPGSLPGLPFRLLHLDVGTVLQHNGAEVGGLVRCVDAAPESVFRQQRQQAGVVNVGVGQQDKVQRSGRNRQTLVLKAVLSLLHAAVHQTQHAAALHHGTGACYLVGGSQKSQFHRAPPYL